MQKKIYKDEIVRQTITDESLLTGIKFGHFQESYSLSEADFIRLDKGKTFSSFSAIAGNSLFATGSWGLNLLVRYMSPFWGEENQIAKWETILFIVGAVLTFFFWLLSLLPNEHKKVMKSMEAHFKRKPKIQQVQSLRSGDDNKR